MSAAILAASQIGSLFSELAISFNVLPLNNETFLLFAKVVTPSKVRPLTMFEFTSAEIAR